MTRPASRPSPRQPRVGDAGHPAEPTQPVVQLLGGDQLAPERRVGSHDARADAGHHPRAEHGEGRHHRGHHAVTADGVRAGTAVDGEGVLPPGVGGLGRVHHPYRFELGAEEGQTEHGRGALVARGQLPVPAQDDGGRPDAVGLPCVGSCQERAVGVGTAGDADQSPRRDQGAQLVGAEPEPAGGLRGDHALVGVEMGAQTLVHGAPVCVRTRVAWRARGVALWTTRRRRGPDGPPGGVAGWPRAGPQHDSRRFVVETPRCIVRSVQLGVVSGGGERGRARQGWSSAGCGPRVTPPRGRCTTPPR